MPRKRSRPASAGDRNARLAAQEFDRVFRLRVIAAKSRALVHLQQLEAQSKEEPWLRR